MCKRVYLSRGKFCLVSDDDYERVNQFKWCYDGGYATRNAYIRHEDGTVERQKVMMHRFIMDTPDGMDCDHRNRLHKLDNRRCNLRNATRSQNNANSRVMVGKKSCQYKGVYWHKRDGAWYSEISVNGKRTYLGRFPNAQKAAEAYDKAALKAWGEFAYLNFPELWHIYMLSIVPMFSMATAAVTARRHSF